MHASLKEPYNETAKLREALKAQLLAELDQTQNTVQLQKKNLSRVVDKYAGRCQGGKEADSDGHLRQAPRGAEFYEALSCALRGAAADGGYATRLFPVPIQWVNLSTLLWIPHHGVGTCCYESPRIGRRGGYVGTGPSGSHV